MKYTSPSLYLIAFNCPYCRAYAHQDWHLAYASSAVGALNINSNRINHNPPVLVSANGSLSEIRVNNLRLSLCSSCNKATVWMHDYIIYPQTGEAPPANSDMSDDIRRDYDEASSILDRSPRGSAALLRLAIQKLCKELGKSGKNIDKDIAALVKDGLNVNVQKALDTVRVIGNEAVHPGQIDLTDDRATAGALFNLLNFIVDETISKPKRINEMYDMLPENKLKAIEKRDEKKAP